MMDIKGGLLLWFTIFFDKKVAGSAVNIDANKSAFNNEKLAEELHKPIIRKFKKKEQFIQDIKIIFGVLI